jgi:hypothetical protein
VLLLSLTKRLHLSEYALSEVHATEAPPLPVKESFVVSNSAARSVAADEVIFFVTFGAVAIVRASAEITEIAFITDFFIIPPFILHQSVSDIRFYHNNIIAKRKVKVNTDKPYIPSFFVENVKKKWSF